MNIKIKKLTNTAVLPQFVTNGSIGMDLTADNPDETFQIMPGERQMISTGIAMEIPAGYGGFVFPRSSVGCKMGVSLANCVGVIDNDYRGEIKICLINHGTDTFVVSHGDRIAQMVFMPVEKPTIETVKELSETKRGSGGFGSTGIGINENFFIEQIDLRNCKLKMRLKKVEEELEKHVNCSYSCSEKTDLLKEKYSIRNQLKILEEEE